MTRKQCKALLPIIQAFADGDTVEFFDSLQVTSEGRGTWTTADDIGFGRSVDYYRVIKNGEAIYFGNHHF